MWSPSWRSGEPQQAMWMERDRYSAAHCRIDHQPSLKISLSGLRRSVGFTELSAKCVGDVVVGAGLEKLISRWLSMISCFTAADGSASRPGWCQKGMQWNDSCKTWLEHHMTRANPHFPHRLLKIRRSICPYVRRLQDLVRIILPSAVSCITAMSCWWLTVWTISWSSESSDTSTLASPRKQMELYPLVWPPFPGALWDVCLPEGYGSDGCLSLSKLFPRKHLSTWKRQVVPLVHWDKRGARLLN